MHGVLIPSFWSQTPFLLCNLHWWWQACRWRLPLFVNGEHISDQTVLSAYLHCRPKGLDTKISSANHHVIHSTSMAQSQKEWITSFKEKRERENGSHCTVHPYCQDRAHLRFLFLNLTHQYDSFSMQTWQPHPQRSTKGGNSIMEKGHTLGFIHSLGTGTQDTYNLSHSYPWPILDLSEWEMTKVVGTIKKAQHQTYTSHHKFTTNMAGTCN